MLKQQKALLDEGLDINKDGDVVKVKKEWDASVLNSGGITYRKVNNKAIVTGKQIGRAHV